MQCCLNEARFILPDDFKPAENYFSFEYWFLYTTQDFSPGLLSQICFLKHIVKVLLGCMLILELCESLMWDVQWRFGQFCYETQLKAASVRLCFIKTHKTARNTAVSMARCPQTCLQTEKTFLLMQSSFIFCVTLDCSDWWRSDWSSLKHLPVTAQPVIKIRIVL